MSYMTFQQGCKDCKGETWNAAFGIVGTTHIADAPTKCPHCGSTNIEKVADGWAITKTDGTKEQWPDPLKGKFTGEQSQAAQYGEPTADRVFTPPFQGRLEPSKEVSIVAVPSRHEFEPMPEEVWNLVTGGMDAVTSSYN